MKSTILTIAVVLLLWIGSLQTAEAAGPGRGKGGGGRYWCQAGSNANSPRIQNRGGNFRGRGRGGNSPDCPYRTR